MMKLQIINRDNNIYTLKNINNNTCQIQFEFHDIKNLPDVGDYITIPNQLLNRDDPEYSTFYAFGDLKNGYGREKPSPKEIIYVTNNKNQTKTLKRLYG